MGHSIVRMFVTHRGTGNPACFLHPKCLPIRLFDFFVADILPIFRTMKNLGHSMVRTFVQNQEEILFISAPKESCPCDCSIMLWKFCPSFARTQMFGHSIFRFFVRKQGKCCPCFAHKIVCPFNCSIYLKNFSSANCSPAKHLGHSSVRNFVTNMGKCCPFFVSKNVASCDCLIFL